MGEMADWIIDNEIMEWDGMGQDEAYYPRSKRQIKCKQCGETNLRWKKTKNNKWWFVDRETGEWHSCNKENKNDR